MEELQGSDRPHVVPAVKGGARTALQVSGYVQNEPHWQSVVQVQGCSSKAARKTVRWPPTHICSLSAAVMIKLIAVCFQRASCSSVTPCFLLGEFSLSHARVL